MSLSDSFAGFAGTAIICLAMSTATAGPDKLPDSAPVPQSRAGELRHEARPQEKGTSSAIPASEKACRETLHAAGVAFTAAPAVNARGGCSLPHPVEVSALSPNIRLEPATVLNCRAARVAARLFRTVGMAAAEKHFGARLSAVRHASGYVCRTINGSSGLSEHAFGNALDISGFVLSDGREISVREHKNPQSPEAKFLHEIRTAACDLFTTVLGPGTDSDHAEHFHFDLKRRRSPYCR